MYMYIYVILSVIFLLEVVKEEVSTHLSGKKYRACFFRSRKFDYSLRAIAVVRETHL